MALSSIKIKCRNCGREAVADEFKLHHKLRMVVCPTCYYGRSTSGSPMTSSSSVLSSSAPSSVKMSAAAQESMERLARLKQEPAGTSYKPVSNSDDVQYKCPDCKYVFRHDPYRKYPSQCPYCSKAVPRVRIGW
ncbi:hypothetical protein HYU19_02225 [Candidatus Woesearchaeota archaeon]|nr:hypothetical protein [Candidatus Woesearchaeota archaeon]